MTAPSMTTLLRRIEALEARLGDVEGGYGETLYRLQRATVRTDLRMARVLDHLGVVDVTEGDVDQALDQQ